WDDMPVDAHELVALCAPRPVFISSGSENGDAWVDAKGMFLAGVGAGPVYRLLGQTDLGTTEFPPIETTLIDGDVSFRQHSGGHTSGPNWPTFLTFASRYLQREVCSLWKTEPECSEGESIQVNGISLYFEMRGQGEPLLLLHGGGGSGEHFNLMLPELTKHFRVITPDGRAQGRSTDSNEPLSYRLMAADMAALLDSLDIDSAFVGGWSDGAAIAIHLAIY
ncbi:MAG: alpha/beta fold hydrolase, partial [bacterium]|nr:alpha/beta fold hydrolase [bacterium]